EILENLSLEIMRTKESIENNFSTKINFVYLIGGLTLANGFLDNLSSKLPNLSLNIYNPLDGFIKTEDKIENKKIGSVLVHAIGSCLKFLLS
ncbi:MAG: hypothetical protein NZ866_01955, partial [Patescibacteria group bacterium]|nr:hypothetical protein [Patescibacteria group bacterium]